MKILFLGGTSFFGLSILRTLLRWDYDVTFVTRGNQRPKNILATHIQGNCRDPKLVDQLGKTHWDLIIDNIAFNADHVRSALSLNPSHYFLTSSVAVYSGVGPVKMDGSSESRYAQGKRLAEWALMAQDKVPWTIFRPGIVYGPGDPLDRWRWYLGSLLGPKKHLLICGRSAKLSFTFSEDIPWAYLEAIRKLSTIQGTFFDLAQDELITSRDYVMSHAQFFGITEGAELKMLGPYSYDRDFIATDTSPAKKLLGWKPTPWLEAVKRSAPWFKKQLESRDEGFKSYP